jgi:hypothetical protein
MGGGRSQGEAGLRRPETPRAGLQASPGPSGAPTG